MEKKHTFASLGILLISILLLGCINAGAILPSFGNVPQMAKVNSTYVVNINQNGCGYPPNAGAVYIAYVVKSVKVDGVERTVTLPDSVIGSQGTTPLLYEKNTAGRTILAFSPTTNCGGESFPIFKYDVGAFTGAHNISITVSTGFGSGGCFGYYADCVGKLTSNYYIWNDYVLTDSFTNAGANVTVCGNGKCEAGEDFQHCPGDCPMPVCNNNGICEAGETSSNCPGDCHVATTCSDGTQPGVCSSITAGMRCSASLSLVSDSTCSASAAACSDGTQSGSCSTVSVGKRCTNGLLASDATCTTTTTPTQESPLTTLGNLVRNNLLTVIIVLIVVLGGAYILYKRHEES